MFSSIFSTLGLWGGIIIAILVSKGIWPDSQILLNEKIILLSLPAVFFVGQFIRAILRQKMIKTILEKDGKRMTTACAADLLFFWLWSPIMMFFIITSAFGREVTWRSIRYKLTSPTKTEIINRS